MAVEFTLNEQVKTRAYSIEFKSHLEPMSLSYTNDLKGFRGSVQAGEEQVLEVITQEELDALRATLQKLADAFNPDKDLVQ